MKQVHRTTKLKIYCNKKDLTKITKCNEESAYVWNSLLELSEMNYMNNGRLFNKRELIKLTNDIETKVICAMNKQAVAIKMFEAYKSIGRARKSGRDDLKFPWRRKNYFITEWNYQFFKVDVSLSLIRLTTARYVGKDNKSHNGEIISVWFKQPLPNNIKTLKLLFEHGHYYACISYLIDVEPKQVSSDKVASIDLGEIHAITSVSNKQDQLIITGRKIRSIKQFRNKKYAELRSKMDKCKKGSRQYNKYKIAYFKIRSKARRQLDYHNHKLTRMFVNWAVEKGISTVYCGDVTGIEHGTDKKGSSFTRQKIHQWEYGKIMNLLEYKLDMEGIEFEKVNEAYTSQICPCCGFKNKTKTRNYNCENCEEYFHRDVVGAWNILNWNHRLAFIPHDKTKYLRIA